MKHIAVILAAGSGKRVGENTPKQFIEVAGKTIIEYSLDTFEAHPAIDEIAVVTNKEYMARVKEIIQQRGYTKVQRVLEGGAERYLSSLAAVKAYEQTAETDYERHNQPADCALLLHDAARPLVSPQIISDCIAALATAPAAVVAIPATDTIITTTGTTLDQIPPRQTLYHAQTPQAFYIDTLRQAYSQAMQDPAYEPTDDCSVVHRYLPQCPITIVPGDVKNIKITYPLDLMLMRLLVD